MLIRFSVANYLSFCDLTEFNMVSGDIRSKKDHIETVNGLELLKFSLLYGANGAGKSNLIRSVETVRDLMKNKGVNNLGQCSHRFDKDCLSKPIIFEIEFITNSGVPVIYGLSIQDDLINNEYLYLSGLGKSKDKLVFDRTKTDKNKSKLEVDKKFLKHKSDRDFLQLFGNSILNNSQVALPKFLDFEENLLDMSKIVSEVYQWIIGLNVIHPASKPTKLLFDLSQHQDFLAFSNKLLSNIDLGIKSLGIREYEFDEFFGVGDEEQKIRKKVTEDLKEKEFVPLTFDIIAVREGTHDRPELRIKRLLVEHKGRGSNVQFSLYEESDGTRRIIEYLTMIYEILDKDFRGIYFVDEIERSIHPHLLKEIIKKLVNSDKITGQLIFTTHESNLLDLDLFRQDEVLLTEKDESGKTSFSPLSDFKIRNDLDIRKGYLKGRFGAIPMLANLKDLNWYK